MRIITRNGVDYELINNDCVEVTMGCDFLGRISINPGDWEKIENGADPIAEGWEDGIGNPLSIDGWGERE